MLCGPLLIATPASALPNSIECAASVTSDLGPRQTLRDLDPTILPILPYRTEPKPTEFKPVAKLGGTPVGLYVYRVNNSVAHMQLFEYGDAGRGLLADTALRDDITELTFRSPGGTDMVTAYCFW